MRARSMYWILVGMMCTVACGDKDDGSGDDGDSDGTDATDGTDGTDSADGTEPRLDQDHDGYFSDEDCDDNDYRVYPGAEEVCDGLDNDCNGEVDDGFDSDGDGYVDAARCEEGDDCNDGSASINPGAADVPYNGVDEDCDGEDLLDADLDGYDSIDYGGSDCDDDDPASYPSAPEVPKDGIDQDCDGLDLLDEDGDGFDDDTFGGEDCDDLDPLINPDAWDWDNDTVDANCDDRDGRRLAAADARIRLSGAASRATTYFGVGVADCDLDGDGLQDLVVTAPFINDSSSYNGQVGIWLGANAAAWADGATIDDADVVISGDSTYDFFGYGADCSDLNGDGFDELFVSNGEFVYGNDWTIFRFDGAATWSSTMDSSEASAAFTFDMGATSTGTVYSQSFTLWDVDEDGVADQLVFAPETYNSSSGSMEGDVLWLVDTTLLDASGALEDLSPVPLSLDGIGALMSIGSAGDLNGDGMAELVVSQNNEGLDTDGTTAIYPGSVSFISGAPVAASSVVDEAWASMEGEADEGFGFQFAFGDFDGDGATDACIGGPRVARGGASDAGAVYLFSDVGTTLAGTGTAGPSAATGWMLGDYADGVLGSRLASLGDLDGDGFDDLYATEPGGGLSALGRVRFLSGALMASALAEGSSVTGMQMLEMSADASTDLLGSQYTIGDFDGDGTHDVAIGAPAYDSGRGAVYPMLSSWWTGAGM